LSKDEWTEARKARYNLFVLDVPLNANQSCLRCTDRYDEKCERQLQTSENQAQEKRDLIHRSGSATPTDNQLQLAVSVSHYRMTLTTYTVKSHKRCNNMSRMNFSGLYYVWLYLVECSLLRAV